MNSGKFFAAAASGSTKSNQRPVRDGWPDWMERNREAVHVPVRPPSDQKDRPKGK